MPSRRQLNMAAGVTSTNAPPCILKPRLPLSQFRTMTYPFPNQPVLNGPKSSGLQEHVFLSINIDASSFNTASHVFDHAGRPCQE